MDSKKELAPIFISEEVILIKSSKTKHGKSFYNDKGINCTQRKPIRNTRASNTKRTKHVKQSYSSLPLTQTKRPTQSHKS